jgi:hypothetical protein
VTVITILTVAAAADNDDAMSVSSSILYLAPLLANFAACIDLKPLLLRTVQSPHCRSS